MEPATQALLGAATAELVAGRTLRGRALGWGAAIGMSPDLDVLLGSLHGGYGEWLYHRGTTHSLWFGFVAGPIVGWLLWRWRDFGNTETLPGWIRVAIIALLTHPLLDGFTPYGTQFFAPFVRDRFAWNGVAIVDPFYSTILAAGVVCAAVRSIDPLWRRRGLVLGLAVSTLYLFVGLAVNQRIEGDLRRLIGAESTGIERVRAYPTIFQPWLRSFVVSTPEATYVGLHSWQEAACPVWRRYPRPKDDPAVEAVLSTCEGELFQWFSDGDWIARLHREPDGGTDIRLEDVRYAWASERGGGMWGLEARVDRNGALVDTPRRIARVGPNADDFGRIARLLLGRLPTDPIWTRPPGCVASESRP